MPVKIGTQPVSIDGKDAIGAVASGMAKASGRAIDSSSLRLAIKHSDGKSTELRDGDSLELSATVAAAKPAKPAKKPAPAADKKSPPPKSPFDSK